MAKGKFRSWSIRLLVVAGIVGLTMAGMAGFRAGPPPTVRVETDLPGIGRRTAVTVRVEEPKRGLSDLRVELVQGERVELLRQESYEPLAAWKLWGPRTPADELTLEVGRDTVTGLEEGEATIRVTADRARALLRRPAPVVEELRLPVKLRPPSLQITSMQTYVAQGGCEAVVYRLGASAVRDGVQAGDWFFPGYPLPNGGERDRFALFAVPYDMHDVSGVRVVAEDDVENRAEVSFIDNFTPRPVARDRIRVDDGFLARVVPSILSQTPELDDSGDLLDSYLKINGELRARNAQTLVELARSSRAEFLWNRPFRQLPNSQVTSRFADRRTYTYDGREIDRQDHLGFDLASVRLAEVPASNAGVVVLARYFGIYGNAVVLDHGYGLMSLYGHLSSIAVEEGQEVEQGTVLGRTGATGLAGGDHLHFTLLLQGLPVHPKEWWDGRWIRNRIAAKLGDAFPFRE